MRFIEFKVSLPLTYCLTGKFEAPNPDWVHSDEFPLKEYELMVVTEETLYLSYAGQKYTVPPKSFLLLPPLPPPIISARDSRLRHAASTGFILRRAARFL